MKVHAEIEYTEEGRNIHSDICPEDCSSDGLKDLEYRKLLHTFLDEWLDKSGGTGIFYIANESYEMIEKPVKNTKWRKHGTL